MSLEEMLKELLKEARRWRAVAKVLYDENTLLRGLLSARQRAS